MLTQVYLIGLDFIIDENQKIKILELQNIFQSNTSRAFELSGLKPLERLIKTIKKKYTTLKIDAPQDAKQVDEFARRASLLKEKNTVPNRGIEGIIASKWLFYIICNEYSKLKSYIPQTHIGTIETFKASFGHVDFHNGLYLFKPPYKSAGEDILLIPKTDSFDGLKQFISEKTDVCKRDKFHVHEPFIIQSYLHEGTEEKSISKPVIRVYAAIVVELNGSKSNAFIAIDTKAAYQHIRIKQDPYDFTLKNNEHIPCNIEDMKGQLNQFMNDFFNSIIISQNKLSVKVWEILAKRYISTCDQLRAQQRLLIISQFTLALMQEQRFTRNRLSHYQCFLLEAFLECYEKFDLKECAANGSALVLSNSIAMMVRQNFISYLDEKHYPLHTVVNAYLAILKKQACEGIGLFNDILVKLKNTKSVIPVSISRHSPTFFDYCSRKDIDSFAAASKDYLSMVAGYARR